jgi:hypothetical protein
MATWISIVPFQAYGEIFLVIKLRINFPENLPIVGED